MMALANHPIIHPSSITSRSSLSSAISRAISHHSSAQVTASMLPISSLFVSAMDYSYSQARLIAELLLFLCFHASLEECCAIVIPSTVSGLALRSDSSSLDDVSRLNHLFVVQGPLDRDASVVVVGESHVCLQLLPLRSSRASYR